MATGTIYLIVALFSLAGLGITHKVADFQKCRPAAINVMLFFWASVFFWGYALYKHLGEGVGFFPPFTAAAVIWAAVCGALASVAILTFQIGIRSGRISTSWLVINLSAALPAVLALIVFREWEQGIRWQQPAAVVFVIVSVILLWRDKALETAGEEDGPADVGKETN
jgi:hypothetical protein